MNNWADGSGGAFYTNNTLTFNGINFTSNVCRGRVDVNRHAVGGGGVFMGLKNTFFILPNTAVYWENNHASLGGAIYVEDASPLSYCASVVTPKKNASFSSLVRICQMVLMSNLFSRTTLQMLQAGSVLYGGAIDDCKLLIARTHTVLVKCLT